MHSKYRGLPVHRILQIEDDKKLSSLLKDYLVRYDIELTPCPTPTEGLQKFRSETFDLVILDIMLPEVDGLELCKIIRKESDIPIIMLTARGDVMDRIVGLELGADDYLPKPFEPRELVVRIQNILKRSIPKRSSSKTISFGDLAIFPDKRTATLRKEIIDLTTLEYQLLLLFAQNPGIAFNRDEILNKLKGIDADIFSRSIDILVSRLRNKLDEDSKSPKYIKTVWGTGYIFVGEELVREKLVGEKNEE